MALRDVKEYYKQVEAQYLEMKSDAKDFDELVKAGKIEQSQFDQAQTMLFKIKENYERLTYIMFLFNKPNRKSKKAKYVEKNGDIVNALASATAENVIKESDDVLKEFKKMLKGE